MVLVHGALHQEGILGVDHTGDALLCAFYKYTGLLGVHVVPHPLVGLIARVLQRNGKNNGNQTLTTDVCTSRGSLHVRSVCLCSR